MHEPCELMLIKNLTLVMLSLSTATFGFSQAPEEARLKMQQYTAAQVREDFHYLHQTLQTSSYNLYETTPKVAFDREFQRIDSLLNRTFTKIEVIRLFQRFVVLSRLGHCTRILRSGMSMTSTRETVERFSPLMFASTGRMS